MYKQIEQLKTQLGWQGSTGVLLLLLTWTLHLGVLQSLEQETDYLRNRIDQGQSQKVSRITGLAGHRQDELEQFYDSLPVERDVTDILADIAVVADASGVELKQAEYHLSESGKSAQEYALYYPVQGGYANIRHFVLRVLADHPALALDQVGFQRDKINDPILKADIRFTIFLSSK